MGLWWRVEKLQLGGLPRLSTWEEEEEEEESQSLSIVIKPSNTIVLLKADTQL
jgi:hypothetical protein